MPTLDATVGGAAANSSCTVAFADTYFDSRPDASAWNDPATTTDTKEACLIRATQRLQQFHWKGDRNSTTQALHFPAVGVYDRYSNVYDSDTIPTQIKQACCELALVMLADTSYGGPDGLERYNSITIGEDVFNIRHGGRVGLPGSVTILLADFILSTQARILRA